MNRFKTFTRPHFNKQFESCVIDDFISADWFWDENIIIE